MVECYPVTGRNGIPIHIPFATRDKPDSKGHVWTIPSVMPVVGQRQDRGMGAGRAHVGGWESGLAWGPDANSDHAVHKVGILVRLCPADPCSNCRTSLSDALLRAGIT